MHFQQRCLNSLFFMLLVLTPVPGHAGWLFGDDSGVGRSGLNYDQGYDRNTVVTVTGRVAAVPDFSSDPLTLELNTGNERLVVILSPRWYLQNDNLGWQVGDTLTVRGSHAQGRDGRSYLLAQWVNSPLGGQLVLRSDSGRPGWSGGSHGGRQGAGGGGGGSGGGQVGSRGGMGGRQGR